jgi:hypothetical protein
MSKKGKASLNYMPVFVLYRTILLMSMTAGYSTDNAYAIKEGMELLILNPPPPKSVWIVLIFLSRLLSTLGWNRWKTAKTSDFCLRRQIQVNLL